MNRWTKLVILMALLVVCVGLTSCDDDDNSVGTSSYETQIIGLWECVSVYTDNIIEPLIITDEIKKGRRIKFFSGQFSYQKPNGAWSLDGKKCWVSESDKTFKVTPPETLGEPYYVTDPTEYQWDVCVKYYESSVSFNEVYILDGDSLAIIDHSLERWVGHISIDGDVMTFTYTYQKGDSQTGEIYAEYPGGTAILKRQ